MKKILFAFILLFTFPPIFSQNSIFVEGRGYEGYIFNRDYYHPFIIGKKKDRSTSRIVDIEGNIFDKNGSTPLTIGNLKSRYTPTVEDIQKAEKILKGNTKLIKKESNQGNSTSLKRANFYKYVRQYVGGIDKQGNIIIWVNMIKDKDISDTELEEDVVIIFGGGNNYWSVYIDITQKEYFGLMVNGPI